VTTSGAAVSSSGRPPVEKAGEDGSLEKNLAAVGLDRQDGLRQLSEHHPRQVAVESGEQHRDIRELLLERLLSRLFPRRSDRVIVGQTQQHRRDVGRVVDEDREIDERDRFR
jgi:hypothetical protein